MKKTPVQDLIGSATSLAVGVSKRLGGEKDKLLCLMFHSIKSSTAVDRNTVLPALGLTLSNYVEIFDTFLEAGYKFVSLDQIRLGLPSGGAYVHVTFDDGYYNNVEILPLLRNYNIPAQIFVTTNNILENKKYWWDVVFAEMSKLGKNYIEVCKRIEQLKRLSHLAVTAELTEMYGRAAFAPKSDSDRPLSPDELLVLSREKLITIGNHTRHHVLLDKCDASLVMSEVTCAQEDIKEMIGYAPYSFAYPNGNYDSSILSVLKQNDIEFGFSSDMRVNLLGSDISGERRLTLGRFFFISHLDIGMQCANFRLGGLSPIALFKRYHRFHGKLRAWVYPKKASS